ncbi:MAG: DUF481 domain-containing protein [Saprospiraceae bacterium]
MRDLLLFGLLLTISIGFADAQVVNVERMRIANQKQGWSGSVAGNVDLQRNQRSVFAIGGNAHVQHRTDSNTFLLVGKTGIVKASKADLVNFAFGHFRYTHYVSDFLSLEGFTQLQQNRVNGIASRWLIGVGPRGKVLDNKNANVIVGLLVMREREQEVVDSIPVNRDIRISSYIAGSFTPQSAEYISFTNTTYFQPRIGKFADIRIASDWNVEVSLRQNLKLVTTFNIVYDARPPVGLDKTVYALKNGLRFTFG